MTDVRYRLMMSGSGAIIYNIKGPLAGAGFIL
jgi:hypothetical protein